jgi:hypothetical protein
MARQRTTFGKIMREREKQQRAQAKLEKRAERAETDDEDGVITEPAHDEGDVLASLAKLHEAYDNEQIDFDTFEERRAELMSRLKID